MRAQIQKHFEIRKPLPPPPPKVYVQQVVTEDCRQAWADNQGLDPACIQFLCLRQVHYPLVSSLAL